MLARFVQFACFSPLTVAGRLGIEDSVKCRIQEALELARTQIDAQAFGAPYRDVTEIVQTSHRDA